LAITFKSMCCHVIKTQFFLLIINLNDDTANDVVADNAADRNSEVRGKEVDWKREAASERRGTMSTN